MCFVFWYALTHPEHIPGRTVVQCKIFSFSARNTRLVPFVTSANGRGRMVPRWEFSHQFRTSLVLSLKPLNPHSADIKYALMLQGGNISLLQVWKVWVGVTKGLLVSNAVPSDYSTAATIKRNLLKCPIKKKITDKEHLNRNGYFAHSS